MIKRTSLLWLLMFGAFAGKTQTLTSTFQFTGSGLIGTPATATTPFTGKTFTNAAITVTSVASTANRGPLDTPSKMTRPPFQFQESVLFSLRSPRLLSQP